MVVNNADKITKEQCFYISSWPANVRQLNQAARLHWDIKMRYQAHVKSITFDNDVGFR